MADLGSIGFGPAKLAAITLPLWSNQVANTASTGHLSLTGSNTTGARSGIVEDPAGLPVYNATVALIYRPSAQTIAIRRTNAAGQFAFTGLDKNDLHNYAVVAFDPGNAQNLVAYDLLTAE